jgi:hypothetical protein
VEAPFCCAFLGYRALVSKPGADEGWSAFEAVVRFGAIGLILLGAAVFIGQHSGVRVVWYLVGTATGLIAGAAFAYAFLVRQYGSSRKGRHHLGGLVLLALLALAVREAGAGAGVAILLICAVADIVFSLYFLRRAFADRHP